MLYTAARAEKQVEQRIKAEGVETFLPLHLTSRKWSDRIKKVEVPLFSSYIFVRTTDEALRNLLRISKVSRIVYFNEKPAIVRDSEIAAIRKFVELAQNEVCEFGLTDEVLVAVGPLKDISGKIIKLGRHDLVLYIDSIGVSVRIKKDQVLMKE